jgi:hypothetical protein
LVSLPGSFAFVFGSKRPRAAVASTFQSKSTRGGSGRGQGGAMRRGRGQGASLFRYPS